MEAQLACRDFLQFTQTTGEESCVTQHPIKSGHQAVRIWHVERERYITTINGGTVSQEEEGAESDLSRLLSCL